MKYSLVGPVSILLASFVIGSVFGELPACPKYPMCQERDVTDCSGQAQEDCPGGHAACIRDVETSAIKSCCCIVHDSKYLHLREDASKPPLTSQGLRTYYMRFCPFSQRVMLTSRVKNITMDDIYVNLKYKPSWFANDLGGKVPVTELSTGVLNDDFVEVDYLDEQHPFPRRIHPRDPFKKAIDVQLAKKYQNFIPGKLFEILYGAGFTNSSTVPKLMAEFEGFLTGYGNELEKRGTPFFAGEDYPGFLDYIMWPWIERRPVLQMFYPGAFDYSSNSKQLEAWNERMKQDEAVRHFLFSPEVHFEFALSQRQGDPDYDMIARERQ